MDEPTYGRTGSLAGRSMLTAYVQSLFQHPHEDIVQTGIQKSRIHMGPTIQNTTCSCLKFADDAVIIASNVKNTQQLLNIFVAWCNWADMLIRLDKCSLFGMMKRNNSFDQVEPGVYVGGSRIPPVPIGGSFTYLGKLFEFEMKNKLAKSEICK